MGRYEHLSVNRIHTCLSQASVKLVPEILRAGKGLVMWFYLSCLEKEGMRPAEPLQGT